MNKEINWSGVDLHLDEGQRQMTILALAKLAIERPGFLWALEQIAIPMDNRNSEGKPQLFHQFVDMHTRPPKPLSANETINVLRAQQNALDLLMARVITDGAEPRFMPTKSGAIWDAVVAGYELLQQMEGTEDGKG